VPHGLFEAQTASGIDVSRQVHARTGSYKASAADSSHRTAGNPPECWQISFAVMNRDQCSRYNTETAGNATKHSIVLLLGPPVARGTCTADGTSRCSAAGQGQQQSLQAAKQRTSPGNSQVRIIGYGFHHSAGSSTVLGNAANSYSNGPSTSTRKQPTQGSRAYITKLY